MAGEIAGQVTLVAAPMNSAPPSPATTLSWESGSCTEQHAGCPNGGAFVLLSSPGASTLPAPEHRLQSSSVLMATQQALLIGLPQCSTGHRIVAPAWALAGEQVETVIL